MKLKRRSVAQQILDIMEDAGEPIFLKDIREALGNGYDSPYITARIANLRKRGLVDVKKTSVKTQAGERTLQLYFLL